MIGMTLCPYLSHEHPIRFAHRGSTVLWPENTITAFQGAVNLGYRYIETDAHVTRDGVIVLFHDDRLERVTNGTGPVKDRQWDDLRKLDAAYHFNPGAGFPFRAKGIGIPSLEEAVTTFPEVLFNIDLKQPGMEQVMADFIRRLGVEERVLIASFYDRRLRRFRKRMGDSVATSAGRLEVTEFWVGSRFKKSLKTPAHALQVPPHKGTVTLVDEKMVQAAHAVGMQVHVWTINEPDEMQRLLELGVDGIITDRPDLLNHVIAKKVNNLTG
jgi:glycerophosphoryl diester phosphodiesterase